MDSLERGTELHWYRVGAVIGDGGFGVTYEAEDLNLRRPVALKEYFPRAVAVRAPDGTVRASSSGSAAEEFDWGLSRFVEEARTLARLQHRNVVHVLAVFRANGTAYMAMDYELGASLARLIQAGERLDEPAALRLMLALLDGLEHVHEAGFIHRDIKPSNILVRASDQSPVLVDFGSARRSGRDRDQAMTAVLTPGYAPIEQYDPGPEASRQGPWTDIYGLSATFTHLLTGIPPPDAVQRASSLLRGKAAPGWPTCRTGRGRISRAFARALDAGLRLQPGQRPQSVAEWRAMFPSPDPATPAPQGPAAGLRAVETRAVAPPAAPTDTPDVPAGSGAEGQLRVLVVDDEAFMRNLLQRVLGSVPGVASVVTACDGHDALGRIAELAPDIVVSDLNMHGMDGIEFLRHLGEHNVTAGIVLISGQDERVLDIASELGRAHDLNLLGVIRKPVHPQELKALVARYESTPTRRRTPVHNRTLTEEELLDGLAGEALRVFYQPKVSVTESRVVGVEALARWYDHESHRILGPGAFIPLAESRGHIDLLTDKVFSAAMAAGGAWRAAGLRLAIAVNFAVDSLRRYELPSYIIDESAAHGIAPRDVIVEVTETGVMSDRRAPLEILSRLRMRGVQVAIDDFGTGHSSLEKVRRFPFTELKVDRQFVHGAASDPRAFEILRSSTALARSLGLVVVAEGVETAADWDVVTEVNCDLVQGFLIARPMAAEDIEAFVRAYEQKRTRPD